MQSAESLAQYPDALFEFDRQLDPALIVDRNRGLTDFPFFCRRFLKIRPKKLGAAAVKGKLVPFVFNEAQVIVWNRMCELMRAHMPIRLVILKARQFGISTLFCAWLFWRMWRSMYVHTLLSAQLKPTLQTLLETMDIFYQNMPDGCRPTLRQRTSFSRVPKDGLEFADRHSNLLPVVSKTVDIARGHAIDDGLSTEVGTYEEPDEFFDAFLPAMGDDLDKTMVWESSPSSGWFETFYKAAKRGEAMRTAIFLPWGAVPSLHWLPIVGGRDRAGKRVRFSQSERHYQERMSKLFTSLGYGPVSDEMLLWYRNKYEEYGEDEERFREQYPEDDQTCFERRSISTFRHALPIMRKTVEAAVDPEEGNLHSTSYADPMATQTVTFIPDTTIDQETYPGALVWAHPDPDHVYTIGCDVADETDEVDDDSCFSVIVVFDVNTREMVAEWRGTLDPADLGDECAKWGYYYNTALVNVEINNMGTLTVDRLKRQLQYWHLYRWPKFDEDLNSFTKKMAWYTNPDTKRLLIGSFRNAVRTGMFIVRSIELREEMAHYKYVDGSFEGDGTTSDRIIAAALAWQGVYQTPEYNQIVLGSLAEEQGKRPAAEGAAGRGVKSKHIHVVPRELPKEFGSLEEGVEDIFAEAGY